MRFSDHLRAAGDELWEAQLNHPFIAGIADGSLSEDRFRTWLRQDYTYLLQYVRVASIGVTRSPDEATMKRFAETAHRVLGMELDLHRGYAAEFGVSTEELEHEEMAPATQAYVDHLLRTGLLGDLAELPAALLPCIWGYFWIGGEIAKRPPSPEPRYARWVELYSSDRFQDVVDWCRELTDRLADEGGPRARQGAERAFLTSCRCELACWDQAWDGLPELTRS
ncbi:MAG: thiaminase II [Actinobacteria bacterium]|nr:thiaminase II [Actinomycetota bacterium]